MAAAQEKIDSFFHSDYITKKRQDKIKTCTKVALSLISLVLICLVIFSSEQWSLLESSHALFGNIIGFNIMMIIPSTAFTIFAINEKKGLSYLFLLIPIVLIGVLAWFDYMVYDLVNYFLSNHHLENCIHIISCNGHTNQLSDMWLDHLRTVLSAKV